VTGRLFVNPVVGHTRITHPRGVERIGLVRFLSIARDGEWQLSTTVTVEKRLRPT
jgi:hypothetical protein